MLMGGLGASVWEPPRLGEPPLAVRPGARGATGWDSALQGTGSHGTLGVNSTDPRWEKVYAHSQPLLCASVPSGGWGSDGLWNQGGGHTDAAPHGPGKMRAP